MRTTITLDDDVVQTVRNEMKSGDGKTFKMAVNDLIRRGRYAKKNKNLKPKPYKIHAKDLGTFPHINYERSSELLSILDEEEYR